MRARLARALAAALGIALFIDLLSKLRHAPEELHALWSAGNMMGNHDASYVPEARVFHVAGALEVAILGGLVVLFALAFEERRSLAAVVATGGAFTAVFVDSMSRYVTTVGDRWFSLLCDDANISMRYAENLVAGKGLVYNAGERVEGITNLLWTLLMTIPHVLGVPQRLSALWIMAFGAALLLATALLLRSALVRAGIPWPIQVMAMMGVLFDASLWDFTIGGLETPLVAFGATLAVWGILTMKERSALVGLAIVPFARGDGVGLALLIIVWHFVAEVLTLREPVKAVALRRWKRVAVVLGASGVIGIWRLAYYGQFAPNTAYLKVYAGEGRIRQGFLTYGVRGIFFYGALVLFVLWAAATFPRLRRPLPPMLLPIVGIWTYGIFVGGDAFWNMRFLAPAAPLLWLAVARGVNEGWSEWRVPTRAAVFGGLLMVAPLMSENGVAGSTWPREDWIRQNFIAARTFEANVPRDSEVAIFFAGTIPYLTPGLRYIDVLGKTEAHIAHEPNVHGLVVGHNKFDFDWVYAHRKPAMTFTALACPDVELFFKNKRVMPPLERTDYQAPWYQLADPTFGELYNPNRIILREGDKGAGHKRIGCWFARKDAGFSLVWQLTQL